MNFYLIYDGVTLDNNEFDVRDLSVSLLSIHDLLNEVNLLLNENRCEIRVKVKSSFKTGSFKIEFNVVQNIIDVLFQNVVKPVGIINAIVGFVSLIKWLKGKAPNKIIENGDGSFTVYRGDKYLKWETEVINLYKNYKIAKEFSKLLYPLEKEDGINSFVIKTNSKKDAGFLEITTNEVEYFKFTKKENLLEENIKTTNLSIISLSFREGNKWKVFDGSNSFYVQIRDNEFLNAINKNSISFNKNDIIKVQLLEKQYLQNEELKKDFYIEKIIEHVKTKSQKELEFKES